MPQLQLVITIDDTGRINVNGPLENPLLVYGLLEAAKDAVRKFGEQQERRVQPATSLPPGLSL